MEIKPVKNYQIPKFALALAAVAVAGTMTGCRTSGEVATEGVAPQPVETDIQLMGDEPVAACPTTTEEPVELGGEVAIEDYTVCATELVTNDSIPFDPAVIPDFDDVFEQSNLQGVAYEELFKEAFAEKGITLIPKTLDQSGEADFVWTSEDGEQVQICFFDPDVRRDGVTMHDCIAAYCAREYQWGMVMEFYSAASDAQPEISRQVYVNIDWCAAELNAESVAKIAGDVMQ